MNQPLILCLFAAVALANQGHTYMALGILPAIILAILPPPQTSEVVMARKNAKKSVPAPEPREYRVRITGTAAFTNEYRIVAASPAEALALAKSGNVPVDEEDIHDHVEQYFDVDGTPYDEDGEEC